MSANTIHYPETIEVTFTEEDRQKAHHYHESCGCLLHTALARMGYSSMIGGYGNATMREGEGAYYEPDQHFDAGVEYARATEKPYYKKRVVGMTLTLRRIR